jgi:hypothetical protein
VTHLPRQEDEIMKKTTAKRKLVLKSETLKNLTAHQLARVAGGVSSDCTVLTNTTQPTTLSRASCQQ